MLSLFLLPLLGGAQDPGTSQEERTRDILHVVPADSFVSITTAPWATIRQRWNDNAWGAFFTDDEWDDVFGYLTDVIEMAADRAGSPSPFELIQSVNGEAALFMFPAGAGLGAGFLIDGDGSPDFESKARELIQSVQGDGIRKEHDGVALNVTGSAWQEYSASFFADGVFGACFAKGKEEAVGRAASLIDALRQPIDGHSLLGDRCYQAAVPGGTGRPIFSAYVAVGALAEHKLQERGAFDPDEARMFSILGLSELDWIYAEADLGTDEELDVSLRLSLPDGTLLGDLFDFFGPAPHEFLELMPAESVSVGAQNYDVAGAFQHVKYFMGEWMPDHLEALEEGLDQTAQEFGVNIEYELIDQLSGRFGTFNMLHKGAVADPFGVLAGQDALHQAGGFLIEVHDPLALEDTLFGVFDGFGLGGMINESEHAGIPVHELQFGMMGLHWAFTENVFVTSVYPEPVRAVLEQVGKEGVGSAAANPRFRRELESYDKASIVTLSETRVSVESMVGAMSVVSMLASTGLLGEGMDAELFDFFQLDWPQASLAEEYFEGTLGFALSHRKGVLELRFTGR